MKLYTSVGPNPKVVRMFMAEKGIELPKVEVDIRGGENRREPYLSKNPSGQSPALELDNGTVLAEITAICEYLDELYPKNSLIGTTPEERGNPHVGAPHRSRHHGADGERLPLRRRAQDVPEPHPLHSAGGERPEADRAGKAQMARRAYGRQAIRLRQSADARGYPALRLRRFLRRRGAADQSRAQEHRGVAGPHEGAAERRGVRARATEDAAMRLF